MTKELIVTAALTQDNYGIWRRDGRYVAQWRVESAKRGIGADRWCVQLINEKPEIVERILSPSGDERTFLKRELAQAEVDKRNAILFAN